MACLPAINRGDLVRLTATTLFGPNQDEMTTISSKDVIQVYDVSDFGYIVLEVGGRLYPMEDSTVRKISPLEALALQAGPIVNAEQNAEQNAERNLDDDIQSLSCIDG